MAKIFGFSEEFIRRRISEYEVSHIEDNPKFPDKSIWDIALEGAEKGAEEIKNLLKHQLIGGMPYER